MKQSKTVLPGIALGLVAAMCLAQQATRSNSEFYEFTDLNLKVLGKGRVKITAVGKPMKAVFALHSMEISAGRFEGIVFRTEKKPTMIETAALSGEVHLISRAGTAVSQLRTSTATFQGSTRVIRAPSKISIEYSDRTKASSGEFTAGEGTAILPAESRKASRPGVVSLDLAGGVSGSLKEAVREGGKPAKDPLGAAKTYTISFSAASLTYDDAKGAYELQGNAKVWGDHPLLFGDIKGSSIRMVINTAGEVDEILVKGSPASSEVTRKPPPN